MAAVGASCGDSAALMVHDGATAMLTAVGTELDKYFKGQTSVQDATTKAAQAGTLELSK